METRKITIISTKSNKRTVINSNATTLGELKRDLREVGVDYEGMTFYEGLTKTELKLDESLLPHDVQRINPTTREPETTNELAFMLTNTNKKIRSGALSRAEAYNYIRSHNLREKCQQVFGKNFTMCKTSNLNWLIEAENAKNNKANEQVEVAEVTDAPETPAKPTSLVDIQARSAISRLIEILYCKYDINSSEQDEIISILNGHEKASKTEPDSPYSDNELDEMFRDMPR